MQRTHLRGLCASVIFMVARSVAQQQDAPSLTIYNQNFAVVRQSVPLDLKTGVNHVAFSNITGHVEPDSVVLRDLHGAHLQILEQNYRNDPISEDLRLHMFEGKTLKFKTGTDKDGNPNCCGGEGYTETQKTALLAKKLSGGCGK